MRPTLYTVPALQAVSIEEQAKQAVNYLSLNKQVILSREKVRQLLSIKSQSNTAVRAIVEYIVQSGKAEHMCFIHTAGESDYPMILDTESVVIDTAQSKDVSKLISHVPELYNKALINVTKYTRLSQDGRDITVADINQLHSAILRAYLVMKDKDDVLPPDMQLFVIKSYTMVASAIISRFKNLDPNDTNIVRGLIALYYAQKMDVTNSRIPPILDKCTRFIRDIEDFKFAANENPNVKEDMTIFDLCAAMQTMCTDKMKDFHDGIYFRCLSSIGTDIASISVVHDYPPYWVHQLMLAVSNYGTRLTDLLKRNNLKDDAMKFTNVFLANIITTRLVR